MQKSYSSSVILILMLSLFSRTNSAARVMVEAAKGKAPSASPPGGNGPKPPARAPSPGPTGVAPAPTPWYNDPNIPNSHIVFTRPLPERTNVSPEAYYIKILATIYNGSAEEAKRQLVYSLKGVSAFVAHMKGAQADQLLMHPDVLQIDDIPMNTRLHPGLKN